MSKKPPQKKPPKSKTPGKPDAKPESSSSENIEKELNRIAATLKPSEIRFVHLYLGGEGGACWNNATRAYCIAYDKDDSKESELKVCRTLGSRLLAKVDIQEYRRYLLRKAGYTEDRIKERYGQLAFQDSNLGVAIAATDRMAKIAGVLRDEGLKVNIPELERLSDGIKSILEGKKK